MPPKYVSLTARDCELMDMPTIASQMPIQFANGAAWEAFDGECATCKQFLPAGMVVGMVSRPTPTVAVVEAIGVCGVCQKATRYFYRLHDDMRLSGLRDGRWKEWRPKKSLFDRFVALFCGGK